jgi:hypothetical protein
LTTLVMFAAFCPLISRGKKVVVVGRTIYASDRWKTFPDFLMDHVAHVFGRDWWNTELQKPSESRHVILQWYVKTRKLQAEASKAKGADEVCVFRPNGPSAAYVNLAYDLYVLCHHQLLLESVVGRLRHQDQFQGARYELFVTATCIRAGFDVVHEDESNGTRRHPEFLATHRMTKQSLWVEAKSKHRGGVLGHGGTPDPADPRARVEWLLRNAAGKAPDGPYVVFVDVNLPPKESPILQTPWCKECLDTFCDLGDCSPHLVEPFNLAVFTNHPHHYGGEGEPAPQNSTVAICADRPKYALSDRQMLVELSDAAQAYGRIPMEFPVA